MTTTPDLLTAFAALTDADLISLKKVAASHLRGTQFTEPSDLIHEALLRCLNGTRVWPERVPLQIFLANAMRSIAFADRQCVLTRATFLASQLATDDMEDPLQEFSACAPSAEEAYIALFEMREVERSLVRLEKRFAADRAAFLFLAGRISGRSVKETLRDGSLRRKDYESAKKRLKRGLDFAREAHGKHHGAFL
jgi:hypothetical protein